MAKPCLVIVVAGAFTTSHSAMAHHILFHQIFTIAEADTAQSIHFHHIHSNGFDTFMANGHKGQALGELISCYCMTLIRPQV